MPIPITLRTLRVGAGLTLRDVALRLRVHASTVSRWEAGSVVPGAGTLAALARLYGADAHDAAELLRRFEPAP